LLSVLKTLAETFDGQSDAAALVFGNIRALMGVMDLLGKNSGTTEEIFSRMADTTGMVDQAFARVADTSGFRMNQAMTDLKLTMIELGDLILPVVVPIIEGFASLVGIFGGLSEASDLAKARQQELTEAFVNEGDEASLLVGRLDSIIERHNLLTESAETATEAIEEFTGSSVLLGSALRFGVSAELEALGLTAEQLEGALSGGTDAFLELKSASEILGSDDLTAAGVVDLLREQEGAIGAVTSALADQFEQGAINRQELLDLLVTLDETSVAYKAYRDTLEDNAKKTLKNIDYQRELEEVLSARLVQSVIAVAEETGDYALALETLTDWAEAATAALEEDAAAAAALAATIAAADTATIGFAETVGATVTDLEGWERALLGVDMAHAKLIETENARKRSSSTRWLVLQEEIRLTEELAAAEEAANVNAFRWYAKLADAAAFTASEARAAEDAAAQAERNRISNLRTISDLEWMILGIRQQSLEQTKGATKNVISLLRADRQVRMTEKAINQLLDERNELLGLGVDDDAQSIEQMKQQQEAISKVEEELLKMTGELVTADGVLEYLTEAQARSNDITGQQAQSLIEATRALYDATRAEAMGYGSKIDLIAAGERLAEVQESMFTGAQDVADAETRLKEIDEALTTASEDLALQELAVNDAQRLVAESGDLAYAAAESLSTMFETVLGPSAVGVSDDMNELARSLVEESAKVFPEFDAMRLALEGITFGMTADQIDGYVRSVTGMILTGQGEIAAILAADPPTLDMILARPSTAGMLDTIQTEFDNAGLVIPVALAPIALPTLPAAAAPSPGDQTVLDWLSTPEAAAFLGIPQMAAGGVVASPTLAMIGESGPEAVIPLGRGGMGTTVNVNVAGSVLTESEIGEIVQEQLLRIQGRNQTLEFA